MILNLSERALPFLAEIREIVSLIRDNADRAEREASWPRLSSKLSIRQDCSESFCAREFAGADVTICDSFRLSAAIGHHRDYS
jgi:hypothetical protein